VPQLDLHDLRFVLRRARDRERLREAQRDGVSAQFHAG
jgi:hypothetical protein